MIDQKTLKEVLNYDPETGVFTWLIRPSRAVRAGDVAGNTQINGDGYVVIGFKGKIYRAHRLAWLYTHGEFPKSSIDHVDGIRSNNLMSNLRLATNQQNSRNRALCKERNTSGIKGVSFHKRVGKWQANARVDGVLIHFGYFVDVSEAEKVARAFREKMHGDFYREK